MNPATARQAIDASRCPICGRPNDCQMCTTATYKGPCWCTKVEIPVDLLALVPREFRSKACICRDCVEEFHRHPAGDSSSELLPGDFYFEGGRVVFTAGYLLRRGYCCASGCRHCPYAEEKPLRAAL